MESEELRELTERTYELARRNNKMLKAMRRASFFAGIVKIIFWAAALGVPLWLYYNYLQPVMGDLLGAITQLQNVGSQFQQAGSQVHGVTNGIQFEQLKQILEKVPGINLENLMNR